jgi:hypothetical protein
LSTASETTTRNAASEDAHVGVAFELDNDARASCQLTSAVPENRIQSVAEPSAGLR